MNELDRVLRNVLDRKHGGDFHDLTGVHEIRYQPDHIGFRREE